MQSLRNVHQKPLERNPPLRVDVKSVTWNKDSHGLFDYECKTSNQKKFSIDNSSKLFRIQSNSDVILKTLEELHREKTSSSDTVALAEIVRDESGAAGPHEQRYLLKVQRQSSEMDVEEQESPYLIVRSLKNKEGEQKGHPLEIGDIIKLGRIEYAISELKTPEKTFSTRVNDHHSETIYEVPGVLTGQCKICLREDEDDEDFFVSPCSCKGSCSIVHINCLKRWIESKMVVKQHEAAISYNFTKFECEICKDPYPKLIKKDDIGHELFVLKRPTHPYIMLEALQQENRQNKTMYLISAPKSKQDSIKLGRGHQCQIRISDISVSREHAHIRYINDQFLIYDNTSKFGTLVKLQKDMEIQRSKVAIQFGRTVITLKMDQAEPTKERVSTQRIRRNDE